LKKLIFCVTNDLNFDQRMQRICGSLANAGYAVELVGRVLPDSKSLQKFSFSQKRLSCFFNKGKLFYIEYNIRLFFYLLFKPSDAICAIDLDTIAAVYFAGKLKGTKLVYDAHEYFPEVPEVVRRPFTQKVWRLVGQFFVPRYHVTYTVTQSIAEVFEKLYSVKVSVIRNLTDNREQKIEVNDFHTSFIIPDSKFILYQGALNEGRGLEHLIDAMQNIDLKCVLAGDGDIAQELKNKVKKLGLEEQVFFTGKIAPSDLKVLTEKAYIGINLLENKGLSYYYSLANKFFDYLHAGIPQICINFPEYKRINEIYEVAVPLDDLNTSTIQLAIEKLMNDHAFYAQLKENCIPCAKDLNWENEEKKLVAIYDQLF
jgi:glycosyltransferase involved in cell wall biosynthesis